MKKQTLLCLTLTLLGMVLLCSLAIYLKASDPSDELLAHTQKTQSEADAVIETLRRSVQQADRGTHSRNRIRILRLSSFHLGR